MDVFHSSTEFPHRESRHLPIAMHTKPRWVFWTTWPAGSLTALHSQGLGQAIQPPGFLAGSVNNAFLKEALGRCGEIPDRPKCARSEFRPCWGRPRTALYDLHFLFLMIQGEGHPNHPEI